MVANVILVVVDAFLGKTLFSYGFRVISLGFFRFVGKTLVSYGFRVIRNRRKTYVTLVIPLENPIFLTFWHSLGFHKANIRYLGYSFGKIRFS